MGTFQTFISSKSITPKAIAITSKRIESFDETSRDLMQKLPDGWSSLVGDVLLPLRHWEAGAELVSIEGSRWAWGTTIDQCCVFAAFDRIGNAQNLSRVGIVYGEGHDGALAAAKQRWLEAPEMQGLRRLIEEVLAGTTGQDYAAKLLTVDLTDRLIYGLMYNLLDEAALTGGAGAYSLVAQHFSSWFGDQRRWIDQLVKTWFADPTYAEGNKAAFDAVLATRWAQIVEAVSDLAAAVDARIDAGASASVAASAAAVAADLAALGLTVPGGN